MLFSWGVAWWWRECLFEHWNVSYALCVLLNPLIVDLLLLEVAPNPRTPYIGCYATRTDPIIFVSWIMLLVYDTRRSCVSHGASIISSNHPIVMFILMAISAFKACENPLQFCKLMHWPSMQLTVRQGGSSRLVTVVYQDGMPQLGHPLWPFGVLILS